MKKQKLFLDGSVECDYYLIGICSHLSDYRLIWSLNSLLGTKLSKRIELFNFYDFKKKKEKEFPIYYYEDVLDYSSYYVIKNNFGPNTLITEAPNIDFLFFVQNHLNVKLYKELFEKIKKCKDVLGLFELSPQEFASTQFIDLNL